MFPLFYRYLIEHGADVASVNNDGELAVDIAESDEMEDLLHAVLKEKGWNIWKPGDKIVHFQKEMISGTDAGPDSVGSCGKHDLEILTRAGV